jgi:hypothetical protein
MKTGSARENLPLHLHLHLHLSGSALSRKMKMKMKKMRKRVTAHRPCTDHPPPLHSPLHVE